MWRVRLDKQDGEAGAPVPLHSIPGESRPPMQPGGCGSSEPLPTAGVRPHQSPRWGGRGAPPGPWDIGVPVPARPVLGRSCALWGLQGTQELLAGFSLLGELEEEEEEDDEEKVTPVRPGGLVAVFCPVRLFRQTGQLSCCVGTQGEKGAVQKLVGVERPRGHGRLLTCSSQGTMQPSWNRWLHGSCRTRSPSP